jgi:hypothetical protein
MLERGLPRSGEYGGVAIAIRVMTRKRSYECLD